RPERRGRWSRSPPRPGGGAAGEVASAKRHPPMSGCRVRYPMARVRFASGNRLEGRAVSEVDHLDQAVGNEFVGGRTEMHAIARECQPERAARRADAGATRGGE